MTGGMGARATKPGLHATYYPAGVGTAPTEIVESESRVVFRRRELRRGSGGKGQSNGGDGLVVEFYVRTDQPWLMFATPSSRKHPPPGLGGGEPGRQGVFRVDGEDRFPQGKVRMKPDSVVYLETPGGGGFGVRSK